MKIGLRAPSHLVLQSLPRTLFSVLILYPHPSSDYHPSPITLTTNSSQTCITPKLYSAVYCMNPEAGVLVVWALDMDVDVTS